MTSATLSPPPNREEEAPPTTRRRLRQVVEWTLLTIALLYGFGRAMPQAWNSAESDFPNYYIAANLTRRHVDTAQLYDWVWFQRQKDHLGIRQPLVGAATLTPFSFLVAVPVSYLAPETAAHAWFVANLFFLLVTAWLLHSVSGLRWRDVALLCLLWFPAYQNLRLGQMYMLLLLAIAAALWLRLRHQSFAAGLCVAFATGLKIFPLLFLLYFARKRQWRAAAGLVAGCLAIAVLTIAIYGRSLSTEYVRQQLPAALQGESLDPYDLARSSPSALLHRLFIYEPELNPGPAVGLPLLYAVLHPLLQVLLFAPAFLLAFPGGDSQEDSKLEWAAFLVALLVISTNSASYLFTVLLLPAALLLGNRVVRRSRWLFAALLISLIGVCFPLWRIAGYDGWRALLGVPRLYFLVALTAATALVLYRRNYRYQRRSLVAWSALLALGCGFTLFSTIKQQRHRFDDYPYRIASGTASLLEVSPQANIPPLRAVTMLKNGYAVEAIPAPEENQAREDQLSFALQEKQLIVEKAGVLSNLVERTGRVIAADAFNPALSPDGGTLVFLREKNGKATLWVKDLKSGAEDQVPFSAASNLLDLGFTPEGKLLAAAMIAGAPAIMVYKEDGNWQPVTSGATRFPAASPDGQWLAFSRSDGRYWNLWLRRQSNGEERILFPADCNQVTPTWEADSKTIVYASDCGRGLRLTALVRRKVVP